MYLAASNFFLLPTPEALVKWPRCHFFSLSLMVVCSFSSEYGNEIRLRFPFGFRRKKFAIAKFWHCKSETNLAHQKKSFTFFLTCEIKKDEISSESEEGLINQMNADKSRNELHEHHWTPTSIASLRLTIENISTTVLEYSFLRWHFPNPLFRPISYTVLLPFAHKKTELINFHYGIEYVFGALHLNYYLRFDTVLI